MDSLAQKAGRATKWAAITEIAAKLISPITNMLLARLLTPEAFGIVATIVIVISFAEIFTDAGFQKYIIQHQFKNDEELAISATVAFWTNLAISLIIWLSIYIFRDSIAVLVGNPDIGGTIAFACVCIPIMAFSSIQMAMYKRMLDFKTLFYVRMASVISNLIITVPLAFVLRSHLALIIGTIFQYFANALVLNLRASWHPKWMFSISVLKQMISFTSWTLLESISIWLTANVGTFIVGIYLSAHYLGIYKTSISTVNQFTNMIVASTTAVLFSTLSKLQNDRVEYENTLYRFQRLVGVLLIPLGVGIFVYADFVTSILLGSQWTEAAPFIGLLGITAPAGVLYGSYCSEVFRSMGKPKLSFMTQTIFVAVMIPVLLITASKGYEPLYVARALIKILHIAIHLFFIRFVFKFDLKKMFINVVPATVSACVMGVAGYGLRMVSNSIIWNLFSVVICIIIYFGILFILFRNIRSEILSIFLPKVKQLIKKYRGNSDENK